MSRPILDQLVAIAMEVPDQSVVRVGTRKVVAVKRDGDCVSLELGDEIIPPLEAKPPKKKEKAADGPGLD